MGVGSGQEDRMNADDKEQEYRDEAARLALTSRREQRAAIAWLKDIAADPKVSKADRQLARDRAAALQRRLLPRSQKTKHKP
jgi:hypothetical protein